MKAAAEGVSVKEYKGPAISEKDWGGRVKELTSVQFANKIDEEESLKSAEEEQRLKARAACAHGP